MKKKIVFMVLVAVLLALPFVFKTKIKNNGYAMAIEQEFVETKEDSKETKKEEIKEILRYFGVGAGGVATALAFSIPIYVKIKKAQKCVLDATLGISCEREKNKKLIEKLDKSENERRKQENEFQQIIRSNQEKLDNMENKLSNIEKICKLGFVNNNELVSKGVASEISKVGQDEEHKE